MDYSQSEVVLIESGIGKIQTGTFKILHVINIKEYHDTLERIKDDLAKGIPDNHPLLPFLHNDITTLSHLINRLMPEERSKRSLDEIGTAWKWLAGSPDHDDLMLLKNKINELTDNSNNQLIINRDLIERMQEITNATNSISKILKTSEDFRNTLILQAKYKVEILKEEITNINSAIHLTKSNIVNTFILSEIEIRKIEEIFNQDEIPFQNIEQALNFARIKIVNNSTNIIYIISIPKTVKEICNVITIRPVKNQNTVLNLDYKKIVKCERATFGIKSPCQKINGIELCLESNVANITNNTCIPKLVTNSPHNCSIVNADHINNLEEIEPGLILINNIKENIVINGNEKNVTGTYLIRFSNSTIRIGNKNFTVEEAAYSKPLPALLKHSARNNYTEEILSLQLLKTLHVKSNKRIERLNTEFKTSLCFNISLILALVILLMAVKMRQRRKTSMKIIKMTPHEGMSRPQIEMTVSESQLAAGTTESVIKTKQLANHNINLNQRGSLYNLPYF